MRLTRLKVLLLRSPFRQYEIAGRVGIHPSTLSDYANGKRPIVSRDLRALMAFFQVPADQILGYEDVEIRHGSVKEGGVDA